MNFGKYSHVFWQLLKTELGMIKKSFWDKLINAMIWSSAVIIIMAYVMPSFGLAKNFGVIQALGVVTSIMGFELYGSITKFFADAEGDRHIAYLLTLPMPGWLLLINMVCVFVVNGILLGSITFIVAKCLLWNSFSFAAASIHKSLIIFLVNNIFFGFFGLFMISLIKGLMSMENVFMRVMYPLWFFGGFQFTWYVLYDLCPTLAYFNLLNPYIYGQEGFRGAVLGQAGYLPFWFCVGALVIMTLICGFVSIVRLKKKLDFV